MSQVQMSDPMPTSSAQPRCSFCGRSRWEGGSLVESPAQISEHRAYICLDCAETCRASLIRQRGDGRLRLGYSSVIWLCGIGSALVYGAGCQQRDIWQVVRYSLPEGAGRPWVVILAVATVGAALGMAVACCLAPALWLQSPRGREWMRVVGRTTRPAVFRTRVGAYALLPVLLTVAVLGQAFFVR